jgi:DNA-binding PadR family transcriptional regulator
MDEIGDALFFHRPHDLREAVVKVRGEGPPRGRHRGGPGRGGPGRGGGPFGFEARGPFGFATFGVGGPAGPFGRFPFGRGPKARRGDVRAAALLLIAEAPRNGYQLMQEIENRSGGVWRPSPGSMYPVLQQLEDEGLVHPTGPEGRRVFELTDEGRAYMKDHAAELGAPWSEVADTVGENAVDFHSLIVQVVVAARQVAHVGTRTQVAEAQELLTQMRRRLYRILADEAPEDDEGGGGEAAAPAPDETR